ncbi:MAG TPA: AAA domain-containing protein [Planctomycetota bacterium]|nr:AAA domain-containing protein [Planctomycetota bacterium]
MKIRLENLPALTKGRLLAITCERAGIKGSEVGKIEVGEGQATLEVEDRDARRVIEALDGSEIDGRRVRARLLGEQAGMAPPLPPEEKPFERLRWLLDREREAEWARFEGDLRTMTGPEREEAGQALLGLSVKEQDGGLLGRTIVRFERPKASLPATRIGAGDVVRLSRRDPLDEGNPSGVVLERSPSRITVAFEDELPAWAESGPLRLDRTGDDVTFKRTREALDTFETAKGPAESLREIVFGKRAPRFEEPPRIDAFLDDALNEPQRAAVTLALAAQDLALIHGPPGTGKTKTVVEVVRQALRRGERVLACAPSNHAVDNLVERLVAAKEPVVRVGHPARVSESLREHTLEAKVERTPSREVARRLWREAFALRTKLDRRRERGKETDREERQEMGRLFHDARKQDEVALDHVLGGNSIICATAAGAGGDHLRYRAFDLVVLDEASQATLPLALVALARGKRVVLAGDHKQLPPTVLSREAEHAGLSATLFERLMERFPHAGTLLTLQYRMNERIMEFPSHELYEGKLVAHESCAQRTFAEQDPLVFWDTSGMGHEEEIAEGSTSAKNPGEAGLVAARARALLALGLPAAGLAVIAPYEAQVRLLRDLIPEPAVEVDTVDGFQGREKEAVLVSLVRSNAEGTVGFLADIRRMNVALTRARSRLEVVGDGSTVSSHPFYARFVEHAQRVDAWRSGFEIT